MADDLDQHRPLDVGGELPPGVFGAQRRGVEHANLEKLARVEGLLDGADRRGIQTVFADVKERPERMCERPEVGALF